MLSTNYTMRRKRRTLSIKSQMRNSNINQSNTISLTLNQSMLMSFSVTLTTKVLHNGWMVSYPIFSRESVKSLENKE
jgi:hypothetical protein